MELALTWNLVLLSVLTVVFAFNFLLGQHATIKLILSTYISILTADGFVDFIRKFIFGYLPGIQSLVASVETELFMGLRIGIFVIAILILVIKGGFRIHIEKHSHWAGRTAIHALFAFLSSVLFVGTILIYLSGSSFVEGIIFAADINIYRESFIAQILIDYYQLWFSLPAISFLISSFFFDPSED